MIIDDNLTDIVADRLDAGIRFGDIVEKDTGALCPQAKTAPSAERVDAGRRRR
jgi:hypothetical protein